VVFRRFRREEQQADWLGRGYGSSEDFPEPYGGPDEPGEQDEDDSGYDPERSGPVPDGPGPWDGAANYPPGDRKDFGSLLVPVREGLEIQIKVLDAVTAVSVDVLSGDLLHGRSMLELKAYAAPKSSGIWDDIRQEIADEVAKWQGQSEEAPGPFGTELHAMISTGGTGAHRQLQPQRVLGVDGPRWFLCGIISGPAANSPELAAPLEEVFADVVVIRGDDPRPAKDLLPLQIPEDWLRGLAQQMQQAVQEPANPFGGPGGPGTR
jgi:hypothetical protein